MIINALSVIIGLSGTIALSNTLSYDVEKTAFSNSTVAFLFALMAILLLRYIYAHLDYKDKRGTVISAVYALGLAFALTAGKQLHTVENFDVTNPVLWMQILVIALFFQGPLLYFLQGNLQVNHKADRDAFGMDGVDECQCTKRNTIKAFLVTWLIIFVCWIPVFLAFYPGAFVYDAQDEYIQVVARTFTTHHPLTHVLLLGGAVGFGD